MNGDGIADIVMSAPDMSYDAQNRSRCGAVVVLYGTKAVGKSTILVSSITADTGYIIYGQSSSIVLAGVQNLALGDVNRNGVKDIIIGTNGGRAYVVYGVSGTRGDVDLLLMTSTVGYSIIDSTPKFMMGVGIAVGDFNGDRYADIAVGAPSCPSTTDVSTTGCVHVIFGQAANRPDIQLSLDINILTSPVGFTVFGAEDYQEFGCPIAMGDISGDGYDEIVISAQQTTMGKGTVYIVRGRQLKPETDINLALDPNAAFLVHDSSIYDADLGSALLVTDVSGDGIKDVVIGATGLDGNYYDAGGAVVLYGGWSMSGTSVDLSHLTSDDGFVIVGGSSSGEMTGFSLACGNMNNFGQPELMIGAPRAAGFNSLTDAGVVYVVGTSSMRFVYYCSS